MRAFQTLAALAPLVIIALVTPALPAAAQSQQPSSTPVQIGASLDGFAFGSAEGGSPMIAVANLRVTAPLSNQFALEAFVSIPRRQYESYLGFYGFQVKQRIVRASRGRTDVFATYGAMGVFRHSPARDYSYTYAGQSQINHVPSQNEVILPVLAMVGAGFEQRVARRVAVRVDIQGIVAVVYPVLGVRVSAGVSVPIGHVARD